MYAQPNSAVAVTISKSAPTAARTWRAASAVIDAVVLGLMTSRRGMAPGVYSFPKQAWRRRSGGRRRQPVVERDPAVDHDGGPGDVGGEPVAEERERHAGHVLGRS